VVSGRHDPEGEALTAELRTLGGKAEYLRADVGIEDDVRSLIDATVEVFGRLDAAVNNAGYISSDFGPLVTETAEAYDATFNTNVRGLLFCLKHEVRVMIERGEGSIVNLSSTSGERGVAGGGLYAASKHAVNGLTRSAALEVATVGVRVNAVAPGPIAGDATVSPGVPARARPAGVPTGRLGEVDEIADVITFHLSRGTVHHWSDHRRQRRQDSPLTVETRSLQMAHNRVPAATTAQSPTGTSGVSVLTFRFNAPRWCSWGSSEETRQRRALSGRTKRRAPQAGDRAGLTRS
jgi:NAD(P)-dependent dehydrogenase (short-subunit alcohol dehydrogenase family)